LPFNVAEVEGFRYRVEDVLRGVTETQVVKARKSEIRREIRASETLKAHFEDNPKDAEVLLRHDAPLAPSKVRPTLRVVPSYLLPASLVAAVQAAGGGVGGGGGGGGGAARRADKERRRDLDAFTRGTDRKGKGAKRLAAALAATSGAAGGAAGGGKPATLTEAVAAGGAGAARKLARNDAALIALAEKEVYAPRSGAGGAGRGASRVDPLKALTARRMGKGGKGRK
jgi:hypothetical protein